MIKHDLKIIEHDKQMTKHDPKTTQNITQLKIHFQNDNFG